MQDSTDKMTSVENLNLVWELRCRFAISVRGSGTKSWTQCALLSGEHTG